MAKKLYGVGDQIQVKLRNEVKTAQITRIAPCNGMLTMATVSIPVGDLDSEDGYIVLRADELIA